MSRRLPTFFSRLINYPLVSMDGLMDSFLSTESLIGSERSILFHLRFIFIDILVHG